VRYEETKPREMAAARKECPVAYIAWGAHEWHGVQNPLGLDALKAHHMALALCEEVGGVVLPPVYCGYQTIKPWLGFGMTLEFSRELVEQYLFEHLEGLYGEGFKVIVVIMGHYGGKHVEAMKRAVEHFQDLHRRPRVLAITDYEPAGWVNVCGGDHAGKNETSLMMHFRRELVDVSRLPAGDLSIPGDGCSPDAKEATAAHGAMLAKLFVEQAAPRVRDLLTEAQANWRQEPAAGE